MRRVPLREQLSDDWADLNWPKAARSSLMKLGSFLPRRRSRCCVFCGNARLSVSAELDPSGLTGAAAKLGMPRYTLESKIRSLTINKNRFKTADPTKSN